MRNESRKGIVCHCTNSWMHLVESMDQVAWLTTHQNVVYFLRWYSRYPPLWLNLGDIQLPNPSLWTIFLATIIPLDNLIFVRGTCSWVKLPQHSRRNTHSLSPMILNNNYDGLPTWWGTWLNNTILQRPLNILPQHIFLYNGPPIHPNIL